MSYSPSQIKKKTQVRYLSFERPTLVREEEAVVVEANKSISVGTHFKKFYQRKNMFQKFYQRKNMFQIVVQEKVDFKLKSAGRQKIWVVGMMSNIMGECQKMPMFNRNGKEDPT